LTRAGFILVLLAFLFCLSLILWGTLSTGDLFQSPAGMFHEIRDQWRAYWIHLPPAILDNYRLLKDITINFSLFVPFGFFMGLLARKYLKRPLAVLGLGLALSFGVSRGIEFLQRSVAFRYTDSRDVTWNTLGGIFGVVLALFFLGLLRRFLKAEKGVD